MMKYALLTLLALIVVSPASFATQISKDMANTYFESCKAQRDPNFSAKTQEMFCACTAAQLIENFTVEDMQATAQQNQAGRNATNKMITNVYAPCIQYPAKQYHYKACITNPQVKVLGNPQQVCECSSNLVANNLKQNAKSMFEDILSRNPNITDPMQALYDDPQFQKYAQQQIMSCVR